MRKRLTIGVIAVVLVVVITALYVAFIPKKEEARAIVASRANVVQEVAFTGRLVPKDVVDVSFELSGQVEEVLVEVGDEVSTGDLLLKMDPSTVALELDKAQADLFSAREQAKLVFDSAQADFDNTKDENEALRLKRRQAVIDANKEVDRAREVWEKTKEEFDADSSTAKTAHSVYQTKLSIYNAAQKQLSETLITIGKNNQLKEDAAELSRLKYVSTQQAASSIAGPSSLESLAALARLRVGKSKMTSPISGVVTRIDVDAGEYAVAGSGVVTVATTSNLQLEASVPESDAIKLVLDQIATVTFDALSAADQWQSRVVSISPAAKVIEGVPTYDVTLKIEDDVTSLRAGLTANIEVEAGKREGVIAIPRRAIITEGAREFVLLRGDGDVVEQNIDTGLFGSDGTVEITSGLDEGAEIVLER